MQQISFQGNFLKRVDITKLNIDGTIECFCNIHHESWYPIPTNLYKGYACPICGKIMGQGETDWEDNIEVWVNCSHCGFQSSSRYYYDQYCEENNEDKKNTIMKIIKNKSLKIYLK
jgi:Zn ribbon nucleic-acid-binding protein